jgi:hypothetical protein
MASKGVLFFLAMVIVSAFLIPAPSLYANAQGKSLQSQLLSYAGKEYAGPQDPGYVSYDQTLREYMVKRINNEFGISLDPQKYSGIDLLEIESLLKFKKADEPADLFLKEFPKDR